MKPNLRELCGIIGRALEERAAQIEAARELVSQGRAEVLVVSLGAGGALLVTATVTEHLPAPDLPARSAVGAGDSMVGGIVVALDRGWSISEAVRYGVAAGTATVMTPGTELCHREDVERLFAALDGRSDVQPAS